MLPEPTVEEARTHVPVRARHVQRYEQAFGKVFDVERHDAVRATSNRRCEDMSIVRVGHVKPRAHRLPSHHEGILERESMASTRARRQRYSITEGRLRKAAAVASTLLMSAPKLATTALCARQKPRADQRIRPQPPGALGGIRTPNLLIRSEPRERTMRTMRTKSD